MQLTLYLPAQIFDADAVRYEELNRRLTNARKRVSTRLLKVMTPKSEVDISVRSGAMSAEC